MKKTVSALALAGSLAFVGAGAANAVSSYPAPPTDSVTGTVSATVVTPGATIVFSGSGFTGGERIVIDVTYNNDPQVVGGTGINGPIILNQLISSNTVTANADGTFAADVTLGDAPGTYTLTATGQTSGHQVTATVTVKGTGANAGEDNGLANTGADSAMLLWGAAGIVAVGAGVASVAVARRKNA